MRHVYSSPCSPTSEVPKVRHVYLLCETCLDRRTRFTGNKLPYYEQEGSDGLWIFFAYQNVLFQIDRHSVLQISGSWVRDLSRVNDLFFEAMCFLNVRSYILRPLRVHPWVFISSDPSYIRVIRVIRDSDKQAVQPSSSRSYKTHPSSIKIFSAEGAACLSTGRHVPWSDTEKRHRTLWCKIRQ